MIKIIFMIFCLKVTGEASEKQIAEALRRYVLRAVYVQKSLYTLFRLTQVMLEPREDIIRVSALVLQTFKEMFPIFKNIPIYFKNYLIADMF